MRCGNGHHRHNNIHSGSFDHDGRIDRGPFDYNYHGTLCFRVDRDSGLWHNDYADDNYLYARQSGLNQLLRIAGDDSTTVAQTLPSNISAIMADFDGQSHFWNASASAVTWAESDLVSGSAAYEQMMLSNGTTASPDRYVADWAYIPVLDANADPYVASNGPSTNSNDGARCATNLNA